MLKYLVKKYLTCHLAITIEYALYSNYPNPFNISTTFQFYTPQRNDVQLVIYNLRGSKVESFLNENLAAGSYVRIWNAPVSSGIYFFINLMYLYKV